MIFQIVFNFQQFLVSPNTLLLYFADDDEDFNINYLINRNLEVNIKIYLLNELAN